MYQNEPKCRFFLEKYVPDLADFLGIMWFGTTFFKNLVSYDVFDAEFRVPPS
jgi:hypothetical protein